MPWVVEQRRRDQPEGGYAGSDSQFGILGQIGGMKDPSGMDGQNRSAMLFGATNLLKQDDNKAIEQTP